MLQFVVAGIAVGGVYALLAGGVLLSFVSSGTLNFAFGSMAFFIARLFYFLAGR